MILVSFFACAQSAFIESEGELTARPLPTDHDFYFFTRYTQTTKSLPTFGFYVEFSSDANVAGYSGGVVYKHSGNRQFNFEASVGPELDREIRRKHTTLGVLGNVEFATKKEERTAWNIEGYTTLFYSKDGWWHQSSLTFSPFKWLAVGVHSQTYSVKFAPIVKVKLPGVMTIFLAVGKDKQLIGLNVSGWLK